MKTIVKETINNQWEKEYLQRRAAYSYPHYRMNCRLKEITNIIDNFKAEKIFSILEVGCGDGKLLSALKHCYADASVFGVEPSSFLSAATPDKNIEIINSTIEDLKWNKPSPDFIIMAAVIEHLKDPRIGLMKIKSIMKNNSRLIITYPNPIFDRINSMIVNNGHIQRFSVSRMRTMLHDCGFSIIDAHGFMVNPFIDVPIFNNIAESTAKILKIDNMLFNRIVTAVSYA